MSDHNDNGFKDGQQFPVPLGEEGKTYQKRLKKRAQGILSSLMNKLPSNYRSSIPSTEYAQYLRAMSEQLAKLTIRLEDARKDQSFEDVRSEFLQQVVGHLVFINGKLPDLEFDDEEFRKFLLKVIDIYFQGSTPESIRDALGLFADEDIFTIKESFKDTRKNASAQDIGDQFEFVIEIDNGETFPDDFFRLRRNIDLLLGLVKPAHTLYAARQVFGEVFETSDIDASSEWSLKNHYYEDVRSYWQGMSGFSSDTGKIDQSDKSVLRDTNTTDKPLGQVAEGVLLTVLTGPNAGEYRVLSVDNANNGVTVHPQFEVAEDPVEYQVRKDRKGGNRERGVQAEDKDGQFRPANRMTVDGGGPYTVQKGDTVTLSASSNYNEVEFSWDLTGNGQFDDETGQTVTLDTSSLNGDKMVLSVKGESTVYGKDSTDPNRSNYEPGERAKARFTIHMI